LLLLVVALGLRGKLFSVDNRPRSKAQRSTPRLADANPPARLVQLEAGTRLQGEGPPAGWSHLVMKAIPRLATGDLDSVSDQAHEIAQRIRPLIVADVRRCAGTGGVSFRLDRVGTGLCAPGAGETGDVVVTGSSIAGSRGPWTTKQRLILSAIAYESSHARMAAATSTFALIRTPVTFLISGSHKKIDMCYAVLVDPQSGNLRTIVWPDISANDPQSPFPATARQLSRAVFDLPQDVHATRILGRIAVGWSFAIRELPAGPDEVLPGELRGLLAEPVADDVRAAGIERLLSGRVLDPTKGEFSAAGL
jgi:hypothetical protein